ncbi:uncharacterized protein BDR25DRAFT_303577 [Lindgomyces ingoldianus]|uniref:Uncharacterized protein n=1 Tax=Lindgomyces ingoldianus TaxID=673940 RepID=A0ACB6QWY9_9PLEO|nr:uncharacterized protein BDR25DRAFT_303577 [Lindgomyces ingoldianus]KAF2471025.1 hypothetical protein BDR25DRAFT_303577 [Lindgomyces ingoldianus]
MGDMLYHIKRTLVDIKNDATGALQKVDIRGTYTDLSKAKAAAKNALLEEGYEKEWFTVYDVRQAPEDWKHGDGVFVFAKAPEGEMFKVALETTPNNLNLTGKDGKVEEQLFHVLQTTIHYNTDRSGASRDTSLEGTFTDMEEAKAKALSCLLDEDVSKDSFAEFDEFTGQTDWAFGEDVMVHAVGVGGENYLVSIIRKS